MAVLSLSIAVLSLLVLLVLAPRARARFIAVRIGTDPGFLGLHTSAAKNEFATLGHQLVERGYQEVKDASFVVQTQDMERLVIAPKFLSELRMLPETRLSHSAALVEKHLGFYSGVDTILESHQHSDVCRTQLTQNLPRLLPSMSDELDFAMSKFLANCSTQESTAYPAYGFVFSMVLSVSSRIFVGESHCRNEEWLQVVSAYLNEVVATAKALRPYDPFLRPLLRPFLAPASRMRGILDKAEQVLLPAIKNRQASREEHLDLLQFLVDTSPDGKIRPLVLKLLVLTSAALHTSTMAAVNALYDMCSRPEYIKSLRKEATAALHEDHQSWQFSTVRKLRQLDSFMKESLRCNQPDTLGFHRKAMSSIKLSDSSEIPRGMYINVAAGPMSRDTTFYNAPNTFDPGRFYQPSPAGEDKPAPPPEYEFTGIERGNVVWGNGRLTCPGRWYASAMNKLIIASLLVRYELKFPQGQTTRPQSIYYDGSAIPSPTQEILLREYARSAPANME